MDRLVVVIAMVGAAALAALGCRHVAAPHANTRLQPRPASADPAAGVVSLRFLTSGGPPLPSLPAGRKLVAPFATARPMPEFPAGALAANPMPYAVAVRILIDTNGHIARITDSPLEPSTAGPLAPLFRAAVEAALAGWDFYPGHVDTMKPGEDLDGDGVPDGDTLVSFTPIEVFYDLSFEFRVFDGRPAVTLSSP